ncbi:MAG: hypothetical protein IJV37_02495 [Bacteroidales bacterium]|nr:hypothetical protein [Bacteroidales bacterium]
MRVIRRISAVLLGFVLFLSGVLKLMDPVGARLVVEAYLNFLGLRFLNGMSGLIGTGLALVESLLGAGLITGVWRKIAAIATGVLLGGFTLLTVLLYIKNPAMDCGCFGEAIRLTHLQSLVKNIVLLALWAVSCIPLGKLERTRKVKYVSFPIAAVSLIIFMIYSLVSLPLVDFTPFRQGTELMLPEDIEDPTDERAPTLSISNADGEYEDELLLSGNLLAVSAYDPEKISGRHWERIAALVNEAAALGYTPVVLAASTPSAMAQLELPEGLLERTRYADRKKMLTLNRANGGATYIADGMIVTKWSARSLPETDKLSKLVNTDISESLLSENNGSRVKFQGFLLYVFAVMLLL